MTTTKVPRAPAGLAVAGRKLWASVTDEYDLLAHEELLLLQACRCADQLDRLAVEAASGPPTITNFRGRLDGAPGADGGAPAVDHLEPPARQPPTSEW